MTTLRRGARGPRGRPEYLRLAVLAAILIGASAQPVGAIASESGDEATFEQAISVLEVEVPVQVLRKGQPVRGLTRDDFIVYDDGERREITSFTVIDLMGPATPPATPTEATAGLGPRARRHFLVVFDFALTDLQNLKRGERAARSLIGSLHPSDLVALAFFSFRHGGHVVLNFTSDHGQALQVLDGLGYLLGTRKDPGTAIASSGERDPLALTAGDWRTVLADLGVASGVEASASLEALEMIGDTGDNLGAFLQRNILAHMTAVATAGLEDRQASFVTDLTDGLRALVARAGAIGGHKHLVLLSQGFEGSLAEVRIEGVERVTGGGTWLLAELREATREFRRDGWEIHSVALGGLEAESTFREGLFQLTQQTGGRLIERTNDAGPALRQLLDNRSVTYLLTFAAAGVADDDAYRQIRVELAEGHGRAKLTHRTGYRAPRSSSEMSNLAMAGLLAGRAESTGDRLALAAIPVRVATDRAHVVVVAEIGAEALRAPDPADGVALDLFLYAFDMDGRIHAYSSRRLALDGERAERAAIGSGLKYVGEIDLPPGTYELRCAVRISTATEPLTGLAVVDLRQRASPGDELLVPVFLQPDSQQWLVILDPSDPESPYPFAIADRNVIPAARLELGGDEPRGELLLLSYGRELSTTQFVGRVVARDSIERRAELEAVASAPQPGLGEPHLLLTAFHADGLDAGRYDLQITAPGARDDSSVRLPFWVVSGEPD